MKAKTDQEKVLKLLRKLRKRNTQRNQQKQFRTFGWRRTVLYPVHGQLHGQFGKNILISGDELRELWHGFHPAGFDKGLFMVIRGHIDDSGDGKQIFTLACLMMRGENWQFLSIDWDESIKKKNRELQKQGRKQIRRFHAADINNFAEDYKEWSPDERKEFSKELLHILGKPEHRMYGFSYSILLKLLVKVIPETQPDPKGFANHLLLKLLMCDIGERIAEENKGDLSGIKVALIHDRCSYNGVLQNAFDVMRTDTTFTERSIFATLTPMGWEDCIPLQPADLLAYETYKEVLRQCSENEKDRARPLRIPLSQLLSSDSFRGIAKKLDSDEIVELKSLMDSTTTRLLLAQNQGTE